MKNNEEHNEKCDKSGETCDRPVNPFDFTQISQIEHGVIEEKNK